MTYINSRRGPGKTVKILYDPDKGSEAMRRGLKMLREGKRVAFTMTSCKKARALANQASALQKRMVHQDPEQYI